MPQPNVLAYHCRPHYYDHGLYLLSPQFLEKPDESLGLTEADLRKGNMAVIRVYPVDVLSIIFLCRQCDGPARKVTFDTFKHGVFHGVLIGIMVAILYSSQRLFEERI